MAKGIFITATGTDVGKTYISALLVRSMLNAGLNCGYYKPALSGAVFLNGKLQPGDCNYVVKTSGLEVEPCECVSYVFESAVSPHLAAQIAGEKISIEKIKKDFTRKLEQHDFMVVEGAGGIVCPFDMEDKLLLADVIKALALDIVVVASAELGTINSTVLTVEYARSKKINVRGIVLNRYNEYDAMHRDNKNCIEKLTGVKVIATVSVDAEDIVIDDIEEIFGEI